MEREAPELKRDERGLALVSGAQVVRGDFARMAPRLKPHNLNRELLVRAAKVKGIAEPVAVDATAGLGEDALLLAAAGFRVHLFERNPTIAALLEDALARAADIPDLSAAASRMQLEKADSEPALRQLGFQPDVVLLDPMFPGRQKSAAVKKKLQMLQQLEEPCDDEEALLDAAIAAGPRKVVIKRPVKGPWLADRKPDYTISGKAIRFDCLVLR